MRRNVYGKVLRTLRFTKVIFLNVFSILLKRVYSQSVVFVVYGRGRSERSFSPLWLEKLTEKLGLFHYPVLSFLHCGSRQIGFVIACRHNVEELQENPDFVLQLQNDVILSFPRTKAIALAGRLPSLLHQAGGEIKAPVVGGVVGTRCAMRSVALDLAKRAGMASACESTIAVIGGAGYLGSQVVKDLALEFKKVVAVDIRFDKETKMTKNVLKTNDPSALQGIKLFLLFTSCGDDLAPWVSFIESGSYIADDTHPCVGPALQEVLKSKKIYLLKAAACNIKEPLITSPRLPNFQSDSIPGCLLEALVVARCNSKVTEDFEEFCESARLLGFGSQLMEDLDEVLIGSKT